MTESQDFKDRRLTLGTPNRLKIGLFGANASGGTFFTMVPERWEADWAENVRVAQMADEAGVDFLLPLARWKGYGGHSDPGGFSHETIAWASGLLAKTQRIHVFATVHAPLVNPVFAAKQFVTVDHIGEGRLGINIVVGWNEDEFRMFGVDTPPEARYPYTREWVDCIRRLWASETEFDYDGDFLKLRGLKGRPAPYGGSRPILLNAGMSQIGQSFAIDCCDGLFTTPPKAEFSDAFTQNIAEVKRRAASKGVAYPVYTYAIVICRPTKGEAEDFHQYCLDNADLPAVDKMLATREQAGVELPQDLQERRMSLLKSFGGVRLIGDPDYIAGEFARIAAAGIDGVALILVNQARELPFFLAEVEPRLRRMGLRG